MDLTKNELIVLLAIMRLKEAYGISIRRQVMELTNKDWNYGNLYNTLDKLTHQGLLLKREGEPLPERGGRRKVYYTMTRAGLEAVEKEREFQRVLWEGVVSAHSGRGTE